MFVTFALLVLLLFLIFFNHDVVANPDIFLLPAFNFFFILKSYFWTFELKPSF